MKINGINVEMLLDSGASISCVGSKVWNQIEKPRLETCAELMGYMRTDIPTLGKATVTVKLKNLEKKITLYITKGNDIPLIGRDWIATFKNFLDKNIICSINERKVSENDLVDKFKMVFEQDDRGIIGHTASISISSDAKLRIIKPRPVPFAIKIQVEIEIKRLI